jgi:hypothetical protein
MHATGVKHWSARSGGSENYLYRVFVTNAKSRPHHVIDDYDQRANVENLIGEAQREAKAGTSEEIRQQITMPDHTIRIERLKNALRGGKNPLPREQG